MTKQHTPKGSDVERAAWAMAEVIAKRHGHPTENWMNDQRREEAEAAIATITRSDAPASEVSELVERMVTIADRDGTIGLAADALREGSEVIERQAIKLSAVEGERITLRSLLQTARHCLSVETYPNLTGEIDAALGSDAPVYRMDADEHAAMRRALKSSVTVR